MLIRKIITDDNAALAVIIRSSLKEFHAAKPGTVYFDKTTDHLSDIFTVNRSAYFVITKGKVVAGGAGFFPTYGLPPDTCELVKMYLSYKYRGNGYGQILLEKCMEEAKKEGYRNMYLESMPELVNAIAMYRKNGFENIHSAMGNSGHTGCDVWMIKTL
ncbi:MAG: GNAT family N-acetyltransferase [Ginsengibacter sp.]